MYYIIAQHDIHLNELWYFTSCGISHVAADATLYTYKDAKNRMEYCKDTEGWSYSMLKHIIISDLVDLLCTL